MEPRSKVQVFEIASFSGHVRSYTEALAEALMAIARNGSVIPILSAPVFDMGLMEIDVIGSIKIYLTPNGSYLGFKLPTDLTQEEFLYTLPNPPEVPGIPIVSESGIITFVPRQDLSNLVSVPFSFGDASPKTIKTIASGKVLRSCAIAIENPFNILAPLSLGLPGSQELFLASGGAKSTATGLYESHPEYRFSGDSTVQLTIGSTSGVIQGNGIVYLEVI